VRKGKEGTNRKGEAHKFSSSAMKKDSMVTHRAKGGFFLLNLEEKKKKAISLGWRETGQKRVQELFG